MNAEIKQLKNFLLRKKFHNSITRNKKYLYKKFNFLENYIEENNKLNFSGQLYCLINECEYPKCKFCEEFLKFISFKKGFLKYCINKCEKNIIEYNNTIYKKENSKILVCNEHKTYISLKVFNTLIKNNVECLCEKCSLKIRNENIINEKIIEKTKKKLLKLLVYRKRFNKDYYKIYFPYTYNRIQSINNINSNIFFYKLNQFLYNYNLNCNKKNCNNTVKFNKNFKPKKYCEHCSRKNATKKVGNDFSEIYWKLYLSRHFNIQNCILKLKNDNIIIKNYCKHNKEIILNKKFIKKIKKNGIFSICIDCNKEYYENIYIKNEDIIIKDNWQKIKTLSEEALIFYNPYVWIVINKKMKEQNVNFYEAKYMLYYNISEKPKCLCCDKDVKFSKEAYGYLLHCEEHMFTSYSSLAEYEITEFLKLNNINNIERNIRHLINKELDIYIPNKNIAIEYNGLYYHSELFKLKNYHYDKWKLCKNKNINLISIWEDDWNFKKDIIKSIIKNKLDIIENKIYARKCEIKFVNYKDKYDFLEKNHLQGNCVSTINIGLFYNNELVSLMTFGNKRMVFNLNKNKMGDYELLRFCNKLNTIIIGGASKLFKYFLNNFKVRKIISYANLNISNGNLYEKLEFKNKGWTGLDYSWAKNGKRFHRSNFMKYKLVKEGYDQNKTENEIMHERGYNKIWGIGNLRYEYLIF